MRTKAALFQLSFFLQSLGRWLSLSEAGLYRTVAQGFLAKEMRGHEALSSRGLFLLMPQRLSGRWWSPALGEEPVGWAGLCLPFRRLSYLCAQLCGGSVQWTCLMDKDEAEETWGPSSPGVSATVLSGRKPLLSHTVCSIHKHHGNGGEWQARREPQKQTALNSWPQASGTGFVSFVFPFS